MWEGTNLDMHQIGGTTEQVKYLLRVKAVLGHHNDILKEIWARFAS